MELLNLVLHIHRAEVAQDPTHEADSRGSTVQQAFLHYHDG